MDMSELISRHGLEVALWRNDVPYFDRDLAVAAVDACEKEGVAILGVEGFQVDQGAIIPRTEVPYFDRDQAVAVVDACEEEGSAILGIEGFQIDGEVIVPRMDWIADFSPCSREMEYREFVAIRAKDARVFFELPNSENVLFEFCI